MALDQQHVDGAHVRNYRAPRSAGATRRAAVCGRFAVLRRLGISVTRLPTRRGDGIAGSLLVSATIQRRLTSGPRHSGAGADARAGSDAVARTPGSNREIEGMAARTARRSRNGA